MRSKFFDRTVIIMIIKNGKVFTDQFIFEEKDVYVENGMFVDSAEEVSDRTEINANGNYVIPGLIDVHTHGSFGHDFCDNDIDGLAEIARYQKRCGITSFCPTSMTLPKDLLAECFKNAAELSRQDCGGSRIIGINMEGPFIAMSKKGSQNGKYVHEPDYEFFSDLNRVCGNMIRLVTLAPEVDGADEFIKLAHNEVNISIGHTDADYDAAKKALENGANHLTHMFNAMPPLLHRAPGVIGAAHDDENCMVEMICDGIHIHPSVIRTAFSAFGDDRIVLISDSMMATGMENGEYSLGGQKVFVKDRRATLADGTVAGSATNLFECMQCAIRFGIRPESAVKAATANPAKSIGMYGKLGSISVGKLADALIVDKDFNLIKVISE